MDHAITRAALVLFAAVLLTTASEAQSFLYIVAEEKAALVAAGYRFLTGTSPDGSDVWRCSTAQITWRAAHRLTQLGYPVSLIHKTPGQRGCTHTTGERYSHDAIAFGDTCVDLIRNSETENIPAWTICAGQPVAAADKRPTFVLDVAIQPSPSLPWSSAIETRLHALDGQLFVLEGALSVLEGVVSRLDGRLSVYEAGLTGLERRVEVLEARRIPMTCRAAIRLGVMRIPVSCALQ